jgi:protein O-GlcNAc transferase
MNRKQISNDGSAEDAGAAASIGVAELFGAGLNHQQAGRLAEAEACYWRVLASQPGHSDALHRLGVIAIETRRHSLAAELIEQATKRNGHNPVYFSDLGVALRRLGRFEAAIAAYGQAIHIKPDYADAFYNRGNVLLQLGRLEQAVRIR